MNNHDEWEAVCNIDLFNMSAERRLRIIGQLEEAGLLSIAYIAFSLGGNSPRDILSPEIQQYYREKVVLTVMEQEHIYTLFDIGDNLSNEFFYKVKLRIGKLFQFGNY